MTLQASIRVAAVAIICLPAAALADPPVEGNDGSQASEHPPIHNRLNFRAGFDSANRDGRTQVCFDVSVAYGFGAETCGTGNQVWHNDPGQEMSHYRINYTVVSRNLWKGTLHTRTGLGFAEMQVGKDDPGFVFTGTNAAHASTSGPEGSLSMQWLAPLYKDFDFVITGTAGLAYFAHASELATTKSDLQSFASIDAGIGW